MRTSLIHSGIKPDQQFSHFALGIESVALRRSVRYFLNQVNLQKKIDMIVDRLATNPSEICEFRFVEFSVGWKVEQGVDNLDDRFTGGNDLPARRCICHILRASGPAV